MFFGDFVFWASFFNVLRFFWACFLLLINVLILLFFFCNFLGFFFVFLY